MMALPSRLPRLDLPRFSSLRIAWLLSSLLFLRFAARAEGVVDMPSLIGELASPAMDGRRAGTPGGALAVDLLERELAGLELQALAGFTGWRQGFDFHPRVDAQALSLRAVGLPAAGPADWKALEASAGGELRAPAVFCGFGLCTPQWQDYAPDDVRGRVVLLMRQVPDGLGQGADWQQALLLERRVEAARACGAAAVLVVDSPFDPQAARLRGEGPSGLLRDVGLPVAGLSAAWADSLLSRNGEGLKARLSRITRARKPLPPALLAPELELAIRVERESAHSWNLGAALPGVGAAARRWVLVGAHHDHLGHGADGLGSLHPGADDNASGCALLMALAQSLGDSLRERPGERRSLAFVWFGGEELGRLGSRHLVDSALPWLDSLDLMVNLDMVGRLEDQTLLVLGGAAHPELEPGLAAAGAAAGLRMKSTGEAPGGDHESFRALGRPALMLFTGAHADYHKPGDTLEGIHLAGLEPIRRTLDGWLPTLLDPALAISGEVAPAAQPEGGSPVRVAIGITPGYESQAGGMPVQEVKAGSAAERAGLRKGDILLSLGRFPVANIHDYTFALRHYSAGEELPLSYLRDGLRRQSTVRLEERARP